jgi:hypothetical protein
MVALTSEPGGPVVLTARRYAVRKGFAVSLWARMANPSDFSHERATSRTPLLLPGHPLPLRLARNQFFSQMDWARWPHALFLFKWYKKVRSLSDKMEKSMRPSSPQTHCKHLTFR